MRTAVLILSVICLAYFTPCEVSANRDLYLEEGSGYAGNTTLKLTPPHEGSGFRAPLDDTFDDEDYIYDGDNEEYNYTDEDYLEEYNEEDHPTYDVSEGSASGPLVIPDTHYDEEDPVVIPRQETPALPPGPPVFEEKPTFIEETENKEPFFEEPIVIPEEEEPETIPEAPKTEDPPLTDMDDNPVLLRNNDEGQLSFFARPEMLAAFVGGTVLGLLCAILLVMCIVYRMRKRDEGSYPLDETKRLPLTSSYSPNDKEIYA